MRPSSIYRNFLLSTAVLSIFITPQIGFAQESNAATELKQIVVRGAAKGNGSVDTTSTTQETISARDISNLEEFGRRVDAGVNFNSSSNSVNIRGLQENRVVTTIDGIRINWLKDPRESTKGGVNSFDFNSLSSIDVSKGTNSTRFGSGALGGAVEFKTLSPRDLLKEGKNFGGIVKSGYDTADHSWSNSGAVAGQFDNTSIMLQGGYKRGSETKTQGEIGGYDSARTQANPSDFDQRNLLLKLEHELNAEQAIGLTAEHYNKLAKTHNMRGTTSSYQQGTFNTEEEVERNRVSADYKFNAEGKDSVVDSFNATAYWMKQKLNNRTDAIRNMDARARLPAIPAIPFMGYPGTQSGAALLYGPPYGVYKRDNQLIETTYGLNTGATKEFSVNDMKHEVSLGTEAYFQKTTQFSAGEDNCPVVDWSTVPIYTFPGGSQPGPQSCRMLHTNSSDMPDVDSTVFGFFIEDKIALLDDRLSVTPGVRFDYYKHDPKNTAAYAHAPMFDPKFLKGTSDFAISPKLRLGWQATNEIELFAQYARGFRAPSARELYQSFGAPGSYARLGNPELETETSNGFEVGAKYAGNDVSAGATFFNNYYRNFIDEIQTQAPGGDFPVNGITSFANRDRVHIYGIELNADWQFHENWRTWGSFAWSHGRDTSADEYINSIAPLRAIVGLEYAAEQWGSNVSWTVAAARNKVSNNGFKAPGYGLVDATIWWKPDEVEGLKLQAGVFNLFDKKYWDAVSVPDNTSASAKDYFSESGRSFKVSLTKEF